MGLFGRNKTAQDLTDEQCRRIAHLATGIHWKNVKIRNRHSDYVETMFDIKEISGLGYIDNLYIVVFPSLNVCVYLGEELRATLGQPEIHRLFRRWGIKPTPGGPDHPSFLFNYKKYKE